MFWFTRVIFPFVRSWEKSDITHLRTSGQSTLPKKKTARGVNNWRIKFRWASQPRAREREEQGPSGPLGSSVSCVFCVVASRRAHTPPEKQSTTSYSTSSAPIMAFFWKFVWCWCSAIACLWAEKSAHISALRAPRVYFLDQGSVI